MAMPGLCPLLTKILSHFLLDENNEKPLDCGDNK